MCIIGKGYSVFKIFWDSYCTLIYYFKYAALFIICKLLTTLQLIFYAINSCFCHELLQMHKPIFIVISKHVTSIILCLSGFFQWLVAVQPLVMVTSYKLLAPPHYQLIPHPASQRHLHHLLVEILFHKVGVCVLYMHACVLVCPRVWVYLRRYV